MFFVKVNDVTLFKLFFCIKMVKGNFYIWVLPTSSASLRDSLPSKTNVIPCFFAAQTLVSPQPSMLILIFSKDLGESAISICTLLNTHIHGYFVYSMHPCDLLTTISSVFHCSVIKEIYTTNICMHSWHSLKDKISYF